MTKKQYLQQYLMQQKKINRLNAMLEQEAEDRPQILEEIKRCENLRYEIEGKINKVRDPLLKEVLFLKYTCGKSLLEISYIINYSLRHTERLHKTALSKFKR
ncbi:MAG: hypothetical protein II342_03930 [Clostridia bacterium]|nr:hypothetical protein [Clostridia bacterium]